MPPIVRRAVAAKAGRWRGCVSVASKSANALLSCRYARCATTGCRRHMTSKPPSRPRPTNRKNGACRSKRVDNINAIGMPGT